MSDRESAQRLSSVTPLIPSPHCHQERTSGSAMAPHSTWQIRAPRVALVADARGTLAQAIGGGRLLGVVILEASSLVAARMQASLAELGRGGVFSEGHALDAGCRALLTPDGIGRILAPQEAQALFTRFERAARKTPAPSLRWRARRRRG